MTLPTPPELETHDQLDDAVRQAVETVETVRAEFVHVRGRVDDLDHHLAEIQTIQRRTAERLEHVAAAVDRLQRFDALAGQIDALREIHVETEGRLQRFDQELTRFDRLETRITQLRLELANLLEERERATRAEWSAQVLQRQAEAASLRDQLRGLDERVAAVERLPSQIDAQQHQQRDLLQQLQALSGRFDHVESSFTQLLEAVRRSEHAVGTTVAQQAQAIAEMRTEVGGWRARIEHQVELTREARQLADGLREDAAHLLQAQRAAAEAQRLAEGRVESTLQAVREEVDARWQRFLTERQRDWDVLARDTSAREQALRADLSGVGDAATAEAEALQAAIEAGFEAMGRDLTELKQILAGISRLWRDAAAEAAQALAVELPSSDPSVVSVERRQALRRALRARRGSPAG